MLVQPSVELSAQIRELTGDHMYHPLIGIHPSQKFGSYKKDKWITHNISNPSDEGDEVGDACQVDEIVGHHFRQDCKGLHLPRAFQILKQRAEQQL